jgi:TonB family protein
MLSGLLLFIAALFSQDAGQSVESKNGEFIFSQYPPQSLARGEQGVVQFKASADAKGRVMSCKVTQSSGFKRLDRATCDLIVDHASFKPALDSSGKEREAVHEGFVNWRIPGVSPAAAKVGGKSPDEVVCKRQPRPGSLVAGSRLCLTRREWAEYAQRTQDEFGELQGRLGNTRDVNCNRGADLTQC